MQSINLTTHIGKDGILKVKMPPNIKNKDVNLMIFFQAFDDQEIQEKLDWKTFIEETAGSIDDETFLDILNENTKLENL
jgi:hypothetical protein